MRDVTLTNLDDDYKLDNRFPTEPYEIFGLRGNDSIFANAIQGTFYISGGAGNDSIKTGATGSNATFAVDGGSGNDTITGVGGDNHFVGGSGNDTLTGSFGTFYLEGGSGNDILTLGSFASGVIEGGSGDDVLTGNAQRGEFEMWGGAGNDLLQATGNAATLHEHYNGDSGNDTILALGGDDFLDGGTGRDVLRGGDGSDEIWGGDGNDVFVFTARGMNAGAVAFTDVIQDFERGDTIRFDGLHLKMSDLVITDGSEGAEIAYTDNAHVVNTIVLVGMEAAELRPADFTFV